MAFNLKHPRCPYCREEVTPGEGRGCAECMGWAHSECWLEHGKCPACGAEGESLPEASSKEAAEGAAAGMILAGLFLAVVAGAILMLFSLLL